MKRLWLLFAQTVTVLVAVWFVLITLKPEWVQRPSWNTDLQVFEVAPGAISPTVSAGSLSYAAKKASPAVVSINTSQKAGLQKNKDPWFRYFFGDQDDSAQTGLGSGVIVSPQGYILTNNHVVEAADEILVMLNDGRQAQAKVIGTDPETDLAVLKVNLDKLPVMVMNNSEQLQVGDIVLAIGNPFGVGQTVTSGIISALGRNQLGINTFENFIQTDAAINPGNSGGALVDVQGNLLGINTAIYSKSGGSMGIGFAIPVSIAKQVLEGIVKDGLVTRGWIGVEPTELSPELAQTFNVNRQEGVIITGVLQTGPAFKAGVRPGDMLLAVNEHKVQNVAQLLEQVSLLKPGVDAQLKILRKEQEQVLSVTPLQRPKVRAERR
ncbi:MAG: PDZ domain-containing protein [Betaproteobacteria bacterium]|nr:PDZ domain-containing protein [Betaproteobacteria bacterium]NDF05800.1 PDZ domain-containing protein [Betaproteobacteria bacterium]